MIPNVCHSNVRILVERFGGKQLLGYGVGKQEVERKLGVEKEFYIYYHSVWITPEGEVIDPTSHKRKDEYTYFSPVLIYKSEGFWINGMDLYFPDYLIKKGFYIGDDNSFGWGNPIPNEENISDIEEFIFPLKKLCWKRTLFSNLYEIREEGGFTEPSLTTGKTYK